jgi:NitT/TauT family transport system ATP-binding protein
MLDLVGLGDLATGGRTSSRVGSGSASRLPVRSRSSPTCSSWTSRFSALDSFTRESLQDELLRIRAATGRTILFVTHDIDEAVYLADRVVVLTGKPAGIGAEVRVTAPQPRRRRDPALAEASRQLRTELSQRSAEL